MPIIYSISRKTIGDKAEVHIRFYNGRACDLRARTRVFVPISTWNAAEGRCNISRRYENAETIAARKAQAQLDELTSRVLNAYAVAGGKVSKEWLQALIDKADEEKPLTEIVDTYCATKDLAPRTRYKFHSLRMHLQRFEKETHRRLFAHSISVADLDALVRYFRKSLGQNALATRMRQIRALVYFGGRPYPNPFENYTLPQEVYADPTFLTADELQLITNCKQLTQAKAVQRDIFVFQCLTGCRVSDMYSLTARNVQDGWLIYSPSKTAHSTGRVVEVPLTDTAMQLIERYKGVDKKNRLFPFIADIHYNEAIRDILKAAGITRPVIWRDPKTGATEPRQICDIGSSHLARRTFTQIAYARTGNKRLVASMTGHIENSQAFNRYSEVTREMKRNALGIE